MKSIVKTYKLVGLITAFSMCVIAAQAQEPSAVNAAEGTPSSQQKEHMPPAVRDYSPHEFSIWGAGGISTLHYNARFSEQRTNPGGAFGLGYTWFFAPQWGISLGAEMAVYNGYVRLNQLTDNFETQDPDGDEITYFSQISKYRENQRLWNVNVPLAFVFQTGETHKFYASLGFKLGIPVSSKYKSYDTEFITYGYQHALNVTYYHQPDLGYGTWTDKDRKGNADFGLSYMGTAEAGVKWTLSPRLSLYTGVYADYSFNTILDSKGSDKFVVYNHHEPANFHTNSILTSQVRQQDATERFTDKVQPMALGGKIKLGINLGKVEKKKNEKTHQETTNELLKHEYMRSIKKSADASRAAADESKEAVQEVKDIIADFRKELDDYLAQAEQRRKAYGVQNRSGHLEIDNYNLSVVTLSPVQRAYLTELANKMRENEQIKLEITGHTCNLGTSELNMRIGQERADLAKDFLVENGIRPSRITTASKGKHAPIVPNNNEKNRRQNRRLEFKFFND